jgi:hypothetical protein
MSKKYSWAENSYLAARQVIQSVLLKRDICYPSLQLYVAILGRTYTHHRKFQPREANVNFVEQSHHDLVDMRTYKPHVGEETKACETGR